MNTEQCVAVTFGVDLGKTWFHVVGLDTAGSPVKRAKLNRASITRFFVNLPRALIGMEACTFFGARSAAPYPATLEGAVRSGIAAAQAVITAGAKNDQKLV